MNHIQIGMLYNKYCTFNYPYKDINDKLYNIIDSLPKKETKGGGQITSMNLHEHEIYDNVLDLRGEDVSFSLDAIDKILAYVIKCIPNTAIKLGEGNSYRGKMNYNLNEFKIAQCWGITYDKGQNVVKHNHFPYCLSFVYFIKVPRGSSPLIIEGKRIKAEESKLVMFHANQVHWCNKSNVDGRCCLVGNIRY